MDVTELALTWVGWPNSKKTYCEKLTCEHKSTQVHARPGQPELQVGPSFQLASTCTSVCLGLKKCRMAKYHHHGKTWIWDCLRQQFKLSENCTKIQNYMDKYASLRKSQNFKTRWFLTSSPDLKSHSTCTYMLYISDLITLDIWLNYSK